MRSVRFGTPALLAVVAILTCSVARADTMDAPAQVMAQPDGSFSFDATFHKGAGSDHFAGYSYYGMQNVTAGLFADCFCEPTCPVYGPGYHFTFTVSGQLIDPQQSGLVAESFGFCSTPGASAMTIVLPYSTTGVGPSPVRDARLWNEPNPCSTRTVFHYQLAEAGPVTLGVYDLRGRLVARVVDAVQSAGPQQASWDLRATAGAGGRAGVLFARLTTAGQVQTRTILVR